VVSHHHSLADQLVGPAFDESDELMAQDLPLVPVATDFHHVGAANAAQSHAQDQIVRLDSRRCNLAWFEDRAGAADPGLGGTHRSD
jgi:hypothetical protein